jgi:uncharacterized protein (TIGR03084 family)
MNDILEALADQHAELDRLLAGLDERAWTAPVPRCPGWAVTDVVLHLAQTDEMAAASASGEFREAKRLFDGSSTVDQGADAFVEQERGASPAALLDRWRAASKAQSAALAAADPAVRLPWVTNTLSPAALATTRVAESWIHTGDIADALGIALPRADTRLRHIAWLAWKTLPYAFARAGEELSGPVAVSLHAPDGEAWSFGDAQTATTTVTGAGADWCLVAARRLEPSAADLRAEGPDADDVLALVRTYA